MIRDAFLVEELVRIDCQGLEKKDYKKLGAKLRVSDKINISLTVHHDHLMAHLKANR